MTTSQNDFVLHVRTLSTFCIHFSAFFAPLLSVFSAKGLKLVQHFDETAGRGSGESEGKG